MTDAGEDRDHASAGGRVRRREPRGEAEPLSAPRGSSGQPLLDYPGAAAYLGATQSFLRRLVLEKRVRYYKVGKFVRFRIEDLDAFVNEGRVDPQDVRVHKESTLHRSPRRYSA